ncbi:hypothetical protein C8R43DRAFT_984416 [Mycena crocata]|nr:hypothetical protein C8R43DRAFT_984416 [Mycena crocata]
MAPSSRANRDALRRAKRRKLKEQRRKPEEPWKKHIHLDGSVYYSNMSARLLTTANVLGDEAMSDFILDMYNENFFCFKHIHERRPLFFDADAQMLVSANGGATFASWRRAETYEWDDDAEILVVRGKENFWDYASQFPMQRTYIPDFMGPQFLSALAFGANERILDVKNTTSPFDDTQIERLLQVYWDLAGCGPSTPSDVVPALTFHIARVMFEIENARRRFNYGTTSARRYRDTSIAKPSWCDEVFQLFLGVVLCGTYSNYRTRLESAISRRSAVKLPIFRRLMRSFLTEWADSNLVATVLLSVNVGFLGVQDITGLQHTTSLVSSLLAMTSLVTGLHHVWQHRERTNIEIDEAKRYIYHIRLFWTSTPFEVPARDLAVTAALLALPLATLQWSVLSFTLTIAAFASQSTAGADVEGRILLPILLGLLAVLTCTTVLFFWRISASPTYVEVHKEISTGEDQTRRQQLRRIVVGLWRKWSWKKPMGEMLCMRSLRKPNETV